MSILHIQLLGEFRLVYGDTLITTVNTPRLQALLAYLLLHSEAPQARQHLAFLFWPDSQEAQARTNLRHQLHLLRQALPQPDALLLTTAQTVQWRPEAAYQLDVTEFEQATNAVASVMALQTAVELYQGDLLPSCYDDWILPLRERLRQRFVETLERLIDRFGQAHDYAAAIRYAERLRQFDPLHEATYRHLMRLYALLGDQAGVKRTYQACATIMQRELAAPPLPATEQLYKQLIGIETPLRERHNLVATLTPFVGREAELTKLTSLLADPACRLLTILGTGGIGKTRLALEFAQSQIGRFLHGVYLVPLAAVSAPEFIVSTLADQLKFTFHGAQEPSVQLLNYLREKEMLLVLDSIEHLLAGSDLLVKILQHAPAVKLLVTSRERLKIEGEWLNEIPGLRVPLIQQVEQGEEFSAVQLFLQSTRRIQPDFDPSADDMAAIIRLCQLVDGMPLGIELAASWMRVLSCAEIVQELKQSLDFLASESPTTLPRHRSIRAVIDHSWNLLSQEEQRVFCCLSIFRGGFRREAAVQVAGTSLLSLAALVDKSLVRRQPTGRYDLHELVRQYAVEKLAENRVEQELTQDRHARYYLEFIRQQESQIKSSQAQLAQAAIKLDLDNFRLAWQWAVEQDWAKELGQTTQTLWLFYDTQGWYHEAEALFRQAIDALPVQQDPESWQDERERRIGLGQLLAQQGWFLLQLGLIRKAKALFQQSVTLLRRFGTRAELADALQAFALGAWMAGNYQEAQAMLQEALTIYKGQKSYWSIALCLGALGNLAASVGNYGEAKCLLQQSLVLSQKNGEPKLKSLLLNYLSSIAYILGDYSEAKRCSQESLTLSREINDHWMTLMSLNHLGAVTYQGGAEEWIEVQRLHEESFALARSLGNHREMAVARNYLGYVTCALADYPTAGQHFLAALQMAIEAQLTPLALNALVGLATLLCQQPTTAVVSDSAKKKERAIELLALVLSHPAAAHETKDKAKRLWNDIVLTLLPTQIMAAQERGHARTLEEVAIELLAEYR